VDAAVLVEADAVATAAAVAVVVVAAAAGIEAEHRELEQTTDDGWCGHLPSGYR
jgi:hypothetical protein